mgnify:CR=1 FL=1
MTDKELESKVDFSGLILGFSSAALYYIGHSSIEGKKSGEINFPLALQNIEIVELLKEKTAGNLSQEESRLIEEVLGDLKQKYKTIVQSK